MAFGGSGGFTFGSNNNNQNQSTGFGGFGSSNTNTGGFGSNTTSTGFGSSTAQSNPFGGGGGNAFGSASNTGGFGSQSNTGSSLFGNKSNTSGGLFGSGTSNTTTGGGLFGNSTSTNTGTGFGASSTANNNAFGSNSGGFGGGFGASKPAFGSNSSSTPLFGQGGTGTTGGFGSTNAFGSAGSGTALSNQPIPPSEGTAAVPYAVTTEKEGNGTNAFHTITFQPPYQKYSLEELRLADYNAGRRYGNGGQAGAFGASNFGGFGSSSNGANFGPSTNNNPFISNTSSSTGFGENTSTAFSSNSGGGLFGNNKPASGGLFGVQSTGTGTGGLFGGSNNSTTPASNPFGTGSSSGFGASTGGGLFNNNQTQNQPKPSLFGNTGTSNNSTGFSFGNNSSSTTGNSLFGNNNQQQHPSGGLFGASNNQQQQPKPLFGTSTTGTGFGSTSTQGQQTGSLFGTSNSANTGGGLFSNNQQQSTGGGLFNSTTNTGGGLFGGQQNNASKPGGLFSGTSFGNQQQQSTGGGLFSNSSNTNQSGGGLFGGSTNQPSTSFNLGNQQNQNKPSLFGNTSMNQSGGLFGGSNNNSNSMFGGSMSQPHQNHQQQDYKVASLLDPNPYGQSSIWTGLPAPNMENSKPLVTPLVATQKLKESQAKPPPSLRLNQSRYMTPPRRSGTYGFTYSTYGTPNNAASTPGGNGLSNSMYVSRFSGGSFGRSMGKAASVSNLRSQYTDGESVLTPGAFAPSASRYSSGSIRRLHIDRSIKNDLFTRPPMPALTAPPPATLGLSSSEPASSTNNLDAPETNQKLKKRVSFDRETTGGQSNGGQNGASGALVRTEVDDDDSPAQDRGSSKATNGASADQSRGNELAAVPEDRESETPQTRKPTSQAVSLEDPKPGGYWMKPTRAEMKKMPQAQLKHFSGFEVGRHGAGQVTFDEPVDLTTVPFDDLFVTIVEIHARSVTVYPDASTKPPPGKGLNVPSTITIENSWPRAKGKPAAVKSGPLFDKHLERLMNITGTQFISYDADSGFWTFKVPHYTRYGLDDYDDDEDMDEDFGDSQLSAPPDSIDQYKSADMSVMEIESDDESSRQDDTFSFKQKTIPGGFGRQPVIEDEPEQVLMRSIETDESEHSAISEDEASGSDMDMAGSYPEPAGTLLNLSPSKPSFKPSGLGTPGRPLLDLDGDWEQQLQRTISPRKQNRSALRAAQNKILLDRAYEPIKPKSTTQKKEFRTSLDVMNAIFDRPRSGPGRAGKRQGQAEPAFKYPYAKRAKILDPDDEKMTDADKAFHASFKPHFTSDNSLLCKTATTASTDEEWNSDMLVGDGEAVIAQTGLKPQAPLDLAALLQHAAVKVDKVTKVPKIEYGSNIPFSVVMAAVPPHLQTQEIGRLYDLLHVLFDTYEDEFSYELSQSQKEEFEDRIRKDRLTQYLEEVLSNKDTSMIAEAEKNNPLEAAVRLLAKHDVKGASEILIKSKNFHLSLLVAQINDADGMFQEDMRKQIEAWKSQNTISEMSEDVRTLYELLAGNTTVCQGKPSGAVEDRASTFSISEKYGFDWLQAFALNMWYGRAKNDNIAECVAQFRAHLRNEEGHDEGLASPELNDATDPLWVVLSIFASISEGHGRDMPVLPWGLAALETSWDAGAAFHVFYSIAAALRGEGLSIDAEKADDLPATFASQLEAKADVVGTVYALLHLEDVGDREAMIQDLLNRHAAVLPAHLTADEKQVEDAEERNLLAMLTKLLKLPLEMLAKARALLARSIFDAEAELHYLILAKDHDAAHECLCRRVAPRLVIDEDYDTLTDAVRNFSHISGHDITWWQQGGAVYSNLATLLTLDGKENKGKEKAAVLEKTRKGLEGMKHKFQGKALGEGGLEELEERVAWKEMGKVVAEVMDKEAEDRGGLESEKAILDLPLTADAKTAQARKMAVEYYQRVMATAR